ncbi:hypothetical protein [Fundidesulfovibrio terrae]|uniref:hypothetical protein n=1 Tax=Fundidesulfovibrio terrae TaxID=2922866 RepID=UPI001FAFEE77|nr:hypothetical protein [Fundidesulfovibrio terrae]
MHAHSIHPNRLNSLVILAVLLVLASAACTPKKPSSVQEEPAPQTMINPDALDVDTVYTEGLHSFWSGDYKVAAALFESLARRLDDHSFRTKALFGLACAKLAAASTPEDMKAAQSAWRDWEQASSGSEYQADPRMLTPFIQNPRFAAPAKDGRDVKPQAARQPGEADMARRLQEKEKEVMLLQKQIKALEAIHREIQEKKKMSTQ